MFSVSLLGIDFTGVLLNVLAIIGIIVAGGFLIFFLGDLLLSVLDPQNSALKMNKDKDRSKIMDNQYDRLAEPQKPQELTYGQNNYKTVDYNKALEEERLLKAEKVEPIIFAEPTPAAPKTTAMPIEQKVIQQQPEPVQESTQPEDIFAQLRAEEELFKQEKLKAATQPKNVFEKVQKEKAVQEDDDFDFDDIFFSDDDEEEEETKFDVEEDQVIQMPEEQEQEEELDFNLEEEKIAPEVEQLSMVEPEEVEEDEEVEEIVEQDDSQLKDLKDENENLKKQLEQLLKEKQQEAEKVAELLSKKDKSGKPALSLEEYEEKLEILRERLKYNEKELRSIKKEYIPLKKVRKTLENDKKKLRRREALVAKQKILLYGVNNIVDIDQDKAKKLEDDLDLLDGLRLSVAHCEEVIKNSSERYPVLETSYNILTKNISQIRSDIEEVETQINKLKA